MAIADPCFPLPWKSTTIETKPRSPAPMKLVFDDEGPKFRHALQREGWRGGEGSGWGLRFGFGLG